MIHISDEEEKKRYMPIDIPMVINGRDMSLVTACMMLNVKMYIGHYTRFSVRLYWKFQLEYNYFTVMSRYKRLIR
jgi:hypothetical protein